MAGVETHAYCRPNLGQLEDPLDVPSLQENHDIQKITGGGGGFAGNTMEGDLANQLVAGLDNLANAAVQKNETVERLITMNMQKDKVIASLTKASKRRNAPTIRSLPSSVTRGSGREAGTTAFTGQEEENGKRVWIRPTTAGLMGTKSNTATTAQHAPNDSMATETMQLARTRWVERNTIRIGSHRCDITSQQEIGIKTSIN